MRRSTKFCAWRLLGAVALLAACINAYTDPNDYNRLVAFRDSMRVRSANWAHALQLWKCPTKASNSVPAGTCDPCGQLSDGNWYHMHCRGNSRGWGESGDGTVNGITTNMHITSEGVDGPVPKELCIIPTLREHDFGGQLNKGHLTGPFPRWLGKCYPALEELDLSNNRLTGTIPPYLATLPKISEIKVENNGLIGTIPPQLGSIARLRRFQTEFNNMHGPIPQTFKNAAPYLTQFHLAGNDYEGDLSMMTGGHLTTVTVHDNTKLCGMVPATVRFAKGYNPGGTGLGKPCPGTSGPPGQTSASAPAPQAGAAAPAPSPASAPAPTSSGSGGNTNTEAQQPGTTADPKSSPAMSPAAASLGATGTPSGTTDSSPSGTTGTAGNSSGKPPSPSEGAGQAGGSAGGSTGSTSSPEPASASPAPSGASQGGSPAASGGSGDSGALPAP